MTKQILTFFILTLSSLAIVFSEANAKPPARAVDHAAGPPNERGGPGAGVVEVAQLTPSDASDRFGVGFGGSAAIEGDWIAVGAPQDRQVEYDAGAVYMFRRDESGWVEHEKLVPDDGAMWGFFGGSLAMDGDRLVVGASFVGSTKEGVRVGYVFVRVNNGTPRDLTDDAWILETKLLVPEVPYCCDLGPAVQVVGISGNRIVVGHPANWGFRGAVSIFEHLQGQWVFSARLAGSDTVAGDGFGTPVSISGNRVAAGAERADGGAGVVYVFRHDHGGWIEEGRLSSGDAGARGFGQAISLDCNYLGIGANSATGGHAYVLRLIGRTWVPQADLRLPDASDDTFFGGWVFLHGRNLTFLALDTEKGFGVLYFFERLGTQWLERQRLEASDSPPSAGFGAVVGQSGRYLVAGGALKVYVLRLER